MCPVADGWWSMVKAAIGATFAIDDLDWEVSLVRPPSESVTLRVTV